MEKEKIFIFSLLAVLLLSLSALIIPSVKATGLAMQYGCLAPGYDNNEQTAEANLCNTIFNYYAWYDYNVPPCNAYWAYTTAYYVGYCLDLQSTGYYADWVSNWWVGDYHATYWYPVPGPWGHMWFYGNSGNDISDNEVYSETTNGGTQSSYENFNFIWTCANGGRYWIDPGVWDSIGGITETIPDSDPQPTWTPVNTNTMCGFIDDEPPYAEVGMPFAWTGRTDLSQDGYGSTDYTNYCYIGFEGPSPSMISQLPGSGRTASEFATRFYLNSLIYGLGANSGLDSASQYCYGTNFDSTPLYNGWWHTANGYWWYTTMRVMGDGLYCSPG